MNRWKSICIVAASVAVGLAGCSRRSAKRASQANAGLNLRVVTHAGAPVSRVKLHLVSAKGGPTSTVELALTGTQPAAQVGGVSLENKAQPPEIKEATTLLRVAPGRYLVELTALDATGAKVQGCTSVATAKEAQLEATQGRLRSALFALECDGKPSPVVSVNRPPQNFQVDFPKNRPNQHGTFACGGTADFCVSAWDVDQNPLRFEFEGLDTDVCKLADIQAKPAQDGDPTERRCYQVRCSKDYVGQLKARARVFDQVWRKGSKSDIEQCAAGQSKEACKGQESSRSLEFPLRFLKASMCAPCAGPECEGNEGGTLAERLALADQQKQGKGDLAPTPTRIKSGASSVSLMGSPVLDSGRLDLGGAARQGRL